MEKEHLELMITTLKTQHEQEISLINESYKFIEYENKVISI